MIDKIEIRNFTTQKKCDIEFGPNVTTLVGSSFTGKSTILRAIRFACMNKPSGDKMISWGAEKTSIRLTIDKKKIIRRKGIKQSGNTYKLSKELYKAFGNSVPQPIADLVNMDELNFQGQHDKPFWFCETAGEVSRQLNSIVNLEVIDKTLFNIDSGLRDTKAEIKLTKKRLEGAEKQGKELKFVYVLNTELTYIEELEAERVKILSESTIIDDIIKGYIKHWTSQKNALGSVSDGDTALKKGCVWRRISNSVETLKKHVKSAIAANRIVNSAPPDIISLENIEEQYTDMWNEIGCLESMILDIEHKERVLCEKMKETAILQRDFKRVSKGVCPLCQRPMKKL